MHYDEQFEKAILEASVNIRNEAKHDGSVHINTPEEAQEYIDQAKSDYIIGFKTEVELLASINSHTAHADLVTKHHNWDPLDWWEDGFDDVLKVLRKPRLKDTEGKAADARYCYLGDIAKVAFDHPPMSDEIYQRSIQLGEYLSIIVESVDDNNKENAQYYCSEILNDLMSDKVLHDLVGVRAHALSSGKYTIDGYRSPIDVKLLLDAAARHFLQILFVGDIDKESGFRHEAHIAANMIMISTQLRLHHESNNNKQ